MSDLQQTFFERELSEAEEAALLDELASSDEACAAFSAAAAGDYKRSGFPDPAGAKSRRKLWAASAVVVLGLGWALTRGSDRPVFLNAQVDERTFAEHEAPKAPKPQVVQESREVDTAPATDRLQVQRDAQGFIFTISTERSGAGRLELRSTSGELLRPLYSGQMDAGTWAFRWDGRGGQGQALLPGQYRLAWKHGEQSLGKTVQVEAR